MTTHVFAVTRLLALQRDGSACVRCGSRLDLEVNHVTPLAGASHGAANCLHGLENLETLCRPHHIEATRQQRRYGLL